jgi:hypothetical protein
MVNSIYRVQFCLGITLIKEHQNGKSKRQCKRPAILVDFGKRVPGSQILRQGLIQYGQWIDAQPLAILV